MVINWEYSLNWWPSVPTTKYRNTTTAGSANVSTSATSSTTGNIEKFENIENTDAKRMNHFYRNRVLSMKMHTFLLFYEEDDLYVPKSKKVTQEQCSCKV